MKVIKRSEIKLSAQRQRQEIQPAQVVELMDSIATVGLLHPPVVRQDPGGLGYLLVAGERRLRAVEFLEGQGGQFTHGGQAIPPGSIPITDVGELTEPEAWEAELEENIRRIDLSWQEKAQAVTRLVELRQLQAKSRGEAISPNAVAPTLYPEMHPRAAGEVVRDSLMLSRALSDPDVAKASSRNDALKIIKRKEEAAKSAELGRTVGATYNASVHKLVNTDCITWLKAAEAGQFDVILTDPPYGIDAQEFGNADGKAPGAHAYDDSFDTWTQLMDVFAGESLRVAKPQAHAYVFCDPVNFNALSVRMQGAGWKVFRTPLIWHNPSGQRAPWPHHGPHRRYQACLYAIKGDKNVLKLSSDLVTYPSDDNLGWAAQKPVDLYADYLSRSCRPGDSVLDCFCGTGTIFPASHRLKLRATGIERDATAYGIAVKRLGELR